MIRIFFFLLVSLWGAKAFSQLKIVKDNMACTYGLKNENGGWVVPAKYILIEDLNGFYRVTGEAGKGAMDAAGKVFIEPKYDMVDLTYLGFYRISLNGKNGLVNKGGKMICPPDYTYLLPDGTSGFVLYRQTQNQYHTTFIDTTGRLLLPEIAGYASAFGPNNFSIVGLNPAQDNAVTVKAGAIDRSGKTIIPYEYDFLKFCGDRFLVRKGNKTGVIGLDNKFLLEPKYFIVTHDGGMHCFRDEDVLQIYENGKIGFMRGNGQILIEPSIDEIVSLYYDQQTKQATSLFRTGGKMGILSADYKRTVDAIYDTIIPSVEISWNDPYKSNKRICFRVRKNGKYGLIQDDGTILVPIEYDCSLRSDYAKKPNYFFSKGLDLYLLDYSQEKMVPEKAKFIARHDSLLIFESRGELLPCFVRGKYLESIGSEHFEYRTEGKLFYVATRKAYFYFTSDGKAWMKNKIQYMDFNPVRYAVLVTKTGKYGLYDPFREKMLLDTLYAAINCNYAPFNRVWAQVIPDVSKNQQILNWNPTNSRINLPMQEWLLLDTNGRKLSKTSFDALVHELDTTLACSGGYCGIVDAGMNWLIPPDYVRVAELSQQHFGVLTKGEKYGLLDVKNRLVVDTAYTSLREIFFGAYHNWKYPHPAALEAAGKQRWFLFESPGHQLLWCSDGSSFDSWKGQEAKIQQLLRDFAFKGNTNYSLSALRIQVLSHHDELLKNSVFREGLYSIVWKRYDSAQHCSLLDLVSTPHKRMPESCYGSQNQIQYRLKHLGAKFFSLEMNWNLNGRSSGEMYEMQMPVYEYENRVWRGDSLEKITLAALYPDRNVLEGELIRAVQARDDLKLNCSSPEIMLGQIGEKFSLSQQGIILYYLENQYQQVEFLVPLERLKQNPGTKWLADYLH